MPENIEQLIAELCDGDKNLPSRDAVTVEDVEAMRESIEEEN